MKKLIDKIRPSNIPILFTVLLIFILIIICGEVRLAAGLSYGYQFIIGAFFAIVIAFAFRMPDKMRLTTKINSNSLKYYIVPVLYILTMPLLQGGYNFSFLDKDIILMMSGVGIYEEILTHGICMALLLNKWGDSSKYKAAITSSLCFGFLHFVNIISDPTNSSLILNKITTVFFATFIGIGFAGLAYKSNSIWLVAIIHALIDIAGNVGSEKYFTQIYPNWGWVESIVSVIYFLPFGIYGLWLLKETKLQTAPNTSPSVQPNDLVTA